MAISSYKNNTETLYKIRVQIRSSRFPSIRCSEQISGVKSESEAKKIELKLLKECQRTISEKELQRNISGLSWGEVLEKWHSYQSEVCVKFGGLTQLVLDDYYGGMKKWMSRFQFMSCADISTFQLMEVFNEMASAGVSSGHRLKIRRNIKSVFDFGIKNGSIRLLKNPTFDLIIKKNEESKKPEILTISEIRKLIEIAFATNHSWRHIWAMALLTGMRNGELFALKWTDVDWENKLITVSQSYNCRLRTISSTKAGYWRDVPISQDCLRLLENLKSITGSQVFLLPRLTNWNKGIQAKVLRTFCIENGLPSVRFHTLRACFGTQLLRQGVSSAVVMKIAGWKDLKTMQRYIRLAGVEVSGATDKLEILPPEEIAAKVVSFKLR